MPPEQLVSLINPPPGSTVLDLGAGYGLFTFQLARAVGGKGRVYATDIDPSTITFLKKRSQQVGATNVVPTLVAEAGLDPFYRQQSFDTVLAADMIPLLAEGAETFFSQLKTSIKAGTGRLWIVNLRLDSDFTAFEFGDFTSLTDLIKPANAQSPVLRRLSAEARGALTAVRDSTVPEETRSLIVRDINKMLEDPTLWVEAQAQMDRLSSGEKQIWGYLRELIDKGAATSAIRIPTETTVRPARRLLNRLLVQSLLNTLEWEKAFNLDKHKSLAGWRVLLAFLDQQEKIPQLLRNAGYELVAEHRVLPYHAVWEWKHGS